MDSCILREGRTWSIGRELVYSGIYSALGGLQRFWARRARTSIDVLGLGVTSRQGGWFWGVLKSSIRFKLRKQHQIQVRVVNLFNEIVSKFYLLKY